jgi:hypothetical protein
MEGPCAPGRTAVECSRYFPPASTDPSHAVDFWDPSAALTQACRSPAPGRRRVAT